MDLYIVFENPLLRGLDDYYHKQPDEENMSLLILNSIIPFNNSKEVITLFE